MLPLLLLLAFGAPRSRNDDSLAARIRARIDQLPGAEVGLAYRRLSDGDSLYLNADTSFHAASTMKVPVMIQLFRQVDRGGLSLDQKILIVNQFGSIVDGSPYALNMADDSDSSLYARVGQRVSIRELIDLMITKSSNLATNSMIALAGAAKAESTMRALGASRIRVLRGVEDQKAYDRGMNNTTTARDLAIILAAIQENLAASARSCAAMRAILLAQHFNDGIPAHLPPGTRVAHKTGEITGHRHDAAIVYPPRGSPFVLVILTRGIPDGAAAESLIADLARMVYDHAVAPEHAASAAR